jgi:hypothetical protein
MSDQSPPDPDEPRVSLPPSALTRDDWIRLHGEAFVEWTELTPEQRGQKSTRLWEIYMSLTPSQRRRLMRGDSDLLPGEFQRRIAELWAEEGR